MADLNTRLHRARRALVSLEALATEPYSEVIRDATIKRFEYAVETVWKAAQAMLADRFGIVLASPKPVVRACFANGLLLEDEARLALEMIDHRNLTSHTYDEALATEIFAATTRYRVLLGRWLAAIEAQDSAR